jgi:hypothetical protein
MRRFACVLLVATSVVGWSRLVGAQNVGAQNGAPVAGSPRQAPAAGMFAIGADAGVFAPPKGLDAGAAFGAFVEFYLAPRWSIRGGAGGSGTGVSGSDATLRRIWGGADLLYNWESGLWHPFVAVGAGAVQLRQSDAGIDTTQAVGSAGAGIEYFASPRVSVKFEAAYHWTGQAAGMAHASGATVTAGFKRYF